jgi:hypothetical protein
VIDLVHVGDDPVGDQLDIPVPILAVLAPALLLIATLAVKEQNGKVHHEEVSEDHSPTLGLAGNHILAVAAPEEVGVRLSRGNRVGSGALDHVTRHGGWEDVRPAHNPVTEIVDVAGCTPPSRDKQLGSSSSLNVLEVLYAGVLGVCAESVLLVVDGAEDVVSNGLNCQDCDNAAEAEVDRIHGQITCLDTVCEGNPDQIAKRKHHSESISNEIDGGQDSRLHVECIKRVDGLSSGDQDDGISDATKVAVLLHDECQVEDDPAQHTRAQLAPRLDVNLAKDGQRDAGVEFASNEPIVQHIAGMSSGSELAHLGVLGVLDAERGDVHIDCQEVRDENVGGENSNVVVCNESPDRELGAVDKRARTEDGHGKDGGAEGWRT